MRNKLLKTLLVFLLLPVLVFSACSKNKKMLPKINATRYFKDEITITRYVLANTSEEENSSEINNKSTDMLSLLTAKKANTNNLSKYISFELTAQPVWIYKMYIESISFYVYCNEDSEYQMIIDLFMTDLADEDVILKATSEVVETETYNEQCTILPKAKKAIKCNYKIGKTVAKVAASKLTIKLNSSEVFSGDENGNSTFMWLIYGLEIHGESRAYTKG